MQNAAENAQRLKKPKKFSSLFTGLYEIKFLKKNSRPITIFTFNLLSDTFPGG